MNETSAFHGILSVALGNPDRSLMERYEELSEIEEVASRYYCCTAMILGGTYESLCVGKNERFKEEAQASKIDDGNFLRDIEDRIGVSEENSEDFRRQVLAFVGQRMLSQELTWNMQPKLAKAFEEYKKERE